MNPFPYETPSRVMRRIEEAENVELPSLPELDMFEHSGVDESSASLSISPFAEIDSRKATVVPGFSQSTSSLLSQSRSSRRSISVLSSAASTMTSRTAGAKRRDEPPEGFFEADRIDPVASVDDLASLLIDEPSLLGESMEGSILDLPGEQDLSLEDALESINLSSSRKSPSPVLEPESSTPSGLLRSSVYVSKRRPMPRLREDFLNTSSSLSSNSLQSNVKALSVSPPVQQNTSLTIRPNEDAEATPMFRPRPTVSFREDLSEVSAPSRSFSRSRSEDPLETPMPRTMSARLRAADIELPPSPAVEGEDENEEDEENSKDGYANSSQKDGTVRQLPKGILRDHKTPSPQTSTGSQSMTDSPTTLPHLPASTPSAKILAPYYPAVTPADHHKSFLLSLVQTTNRPRFAAPTPHPRMKARLSHPLSQVHTPESAEKESSFVSTASSHNLAMHARANASFDPTTDVAAKFNHLKLNTYLHGLNKHLSEENKRLQELLVEQQAQHGEGASPRTTSLMSDIVGALQEDLTNVRAERDELREEVEKADGLMEEFRKRCEAQEEQIGTLENQVEEGRKEIKRRTELHAKSARELSEGAEAIVNEVQAKLDNAEEQVQSLRSRLAKEGHEAERVREAEEKAETLREAKVKAELELVKATREANELREEVTVLGYSVTKLREEVENLNGKVVKEKSHVRRLQEEGETRASEDRKKLIALEAKLAESQILFEQQDQGIQALEKDLSKAITHENLMEEQVRQMEAALKESETKLQEADEDVRVYRKKVEFLANEREQAQVEAAQARAELRNTPKNHDLVDVEDLSSSSGSSTLSEKPPPISQIEHERIVSDLEAQIEDAEREIGRLEHGMKESPALQAINRAKTMRVEALEADNKELQEQVVALQNAMQDLSLNPNNRTPMKGNRSFGTLRGRGTPSLLKTPRTPGGALKDLSWLQNPSLSGSVDIQPYVVRIQELHEQLDEAGENLDQMVNELGEAGQSVIKLTEALQASRGRVDELEKTVDTCKRSEDRVRKRLQRCKCGHCSRRFDASNLLVLAANPSTSVIDVDATLDDPEKSRANLQAALEQVNNELATLRSRWAAERQAHDHEKATLRGATTRLNAEIKAESVKVEQERRKAKEDAKRIHSQSEREKAMLQSELDRARKSIAALESDLLEERTKLRSITMEQKRIDREKADIMVKLRWTETDMNNVYEELQKAKGVSRKLENELREQSDTGDKVQELTNKLTANHASLEVLRSERDALTEQHAELQQKFTKVTKDTEAIRKQLSKSQATHDDRRHQLDLRVTEIEDLRLQLQEQAVELQDVELEKNRLSKERMEVARTISTLEADLKRVRRDAESIRKDVTQLKSERAGLMAKSQEDRLTLERAQAHVRQMHTQLVGLQRKVREVEEGRTAMAPAVSEALEKLKLVHIKESKGLMLQIRYLKARCTRENAFRLDLGYQKVYLLKVIEGYNEGERNVLARITRLGFPVRESSKRIKRSLRCIAMAVIFVQRTRTAREAWRVNVANKQAVQAALEDVRRRRATQKS